MDRTVPSGAAPLLALIRKTETGKSGAKAYETIIRHRQGDLAKSIT